MSYFVLIVSVEHGLLISLNINNPSEIIIGYTVKELTCKACPPLYSCTSVGMNLAMPQINLNIQKYVRTERVFLPTTKQHHHHLYYLDVLLSRDFL